MHNILAPIETQYSEHKCQLTPKTDPCTLLTQVLVVDRPSPPQGPMEATDITPDTCTLSWKPPLDDGGSPITNYVVEKMDNMGVSVDCL